jgi:hypothetical protein
VAPATPTTGLGVVKPPPWLRGWSATPKKLRKKKKRSFGFLGWPDHLQGPGVTSATPIPAVRGGFGHPHALGVVWPPQKVKKKKKVLGFWGWSRPKPFFFFFFFLAFWGGRTTPLAMGLVQPPSDQPWGWLQPPLGQKWGGQGAAISFFFLFLF